MLNKKRKQQEAFRMKIGMWEETEIKKMPGEVSYKRS
jgi:hypothetical protein